MQSVVFDWSVRLVLRKNRFDKISKNDMNTSSKHIYVYTCTQLYIIIYIFTHKTMLRGWNCWNGKRSADSLHAVGCRLPLRLPSAEPWPLPSPRRLLREVRPKVSPCVTYGNKLPNKEEAQEAQDAQDAHETWAVLPPSRTWDSYVWLVRRGLFISTAQAAQDIQCLLNWRLSDWAVAGLVVSLHDGRDSRVALPWFATNFQI
jgi:hypothetical protein